MIEKFTLVGHSFGRLSVIAEAPRSIRKGKSLRMWTAKCVCGSVTTIGTGQLRSGHTKSCGCLQAEITTARSLKHGFAPRADRICEYNTWRAMRARCRNPNNQDYKYYGARGITVCERWNDFPAFYADMGPRPSASHSIDRIDTNGDYEPSNCRWADPTVQSNNRRNVIARRA